jgi:hypothetical protein
VFSERLRNFEPFTKSKEAWELTRSSDSDAGMTGTINSATRVKTIIQPHPLGSDGDVQMEASGAGTGLEATPAQDDTAGGSSGDCAIRDVQKNDPCAFPAVPLLFLFCPLWYLTGSLMIPFGVFETSESEIDSPHVRAAGCAVSLGATATYRFTSSGQRHAMGVRLGRNSVPPSSFIYKGGINSPIFGFKFLRSQESQEP